MGVLSLIGIASCERDDGIFANSEHSGEDANVTLRHHSLNELATNAKFTDAFTKVFSKSLFD
ncbi:hypothetical protein, partial [Neptunitalea chrysea]|uniref:hypothetical protein n=1 Tax=Neptunitalea chrysea TaxID=1647581 RepID=UPI002492FA49